MPPAAPGAGEQKDPGTGLVWIIFGSIFLIFVIWMSAHTFIVSTLFRFKLFEISLIRFFTDELGQAATLLEHANPAKVTFNQMMSAMSVVGSYFRFPGFFILLVLGVLLYSRSSVSYFKNVYSMKTLLDKDVDIWPQSKPTISVDLIAEDIDTGVWAMSMSPMRFAKRYRLLREKKSELEEGQLSREKQIKVSVIRNRANRLFAMQLGRPWRGVDALPPHYKALYAAFAAKGARDSEASRKLLEALSESWSNGRVNYSLAKPLLEKYRNNSFVAEVSGRHAYELTVMASLLRLARTDGVLSSADFLWLKVVDRSLWFMLNSVGRQTAFVESAGPFAHWLAENELGRRIKTPMVEVASRALDEAIQMIKYNPDTED